MVNRTQKLLNCKYCGVEFSHWDDRTKCCLLCKESRVYQKTDEFRKKLSSSLKGIPHTWNWKVSAQNVGRKMPWMEGDRNPAKRPEVRQKIGIASSGRHYPGRVRSSTEIINWRIAWKAHDKKIIQMVSNLKRRGAKILFADLPKRVRPDIIYVLNDTAFGIDVKTDSPDEIDFQIELRRKN